MFLKNSLKINEENTKKITAMSVVLYVIKFHVNLHKQRLTKLIYKDCAQSLRGREN